MSSFKDISNVKQKNADSIYRKSHIVGVGVGYKETANVITDQTSLLVLVREKRPLKELTKRERIPEQIDGIETDVLPVGRVVAYSVRPERIRPVLAGSSIGHVEVSCGTLGAMVRDAETGESLILSCNHILADVNQAEIGDPILQPGAAHGGEQTKDTIGRLKRFVPLRFAADANTSGSPSDCWFARLFAGLVNAAAGFTGSGTRLAPVQTKPVNLIDAALASPADASLFHSGILDIGLISGIVHLQVGDKVKKSGCRTQLTRGVVRSVDTEVFVEYSGQTAFFDHQVFTTPMAMGGDSGSLLVDEQNRAAGLVFGGSRLATFVNPIYTVIRELNITFD